MNSLIIAVILVSLAVNVPLVYRALTAWEQQQTWADRV